MTSTMTLMDPATDLPKPGGHVDRGVSLRFTRGSQQFEILAATPCAVRKILESAITRNAQVFYREEWRPVLRWLVDEKEPSKFDHRWFSLAIYISEQGVDDGYHDQEIPD